MGKLQLKAAPHNAQMVYFHQNILTICTTNTLQEVDAADCIMINNNNMY